RGIRARQHAAAPVHARIRRARRAQAARSRLAFFANGPVTSMPNWDRERCANDPEYRRKMRDYMRRYYARHREAITARLRRRWAADPKYRQRKLALDRASWKRKKLREPAHVRTRQLKKYGMTLQDYQ